MLYIGRSDICSYLAYFLSPSSRNKKTPSKKSSYIFLYFRKWNFLALILKNFLYFLKKTFLINSLYFRKQNFLVFQETSYISGSKNVLKKCLMFWEMELSRPKLKKLLIFQAEIPKSKNQKFHIFCLLKKEKKFLILSLIKKQNLLN